MHILENRTVPSNNYRSATLRNTNHTLKGSVSSRWLYYEIARNTYDLNQHKINCEDAIQSWSGALGEGGGITGRLYRLRAGSILNSPRLLFDFVSSSIDTVRFPLIKCPRHFELFLFESVSLRIRSMFSSNVFDTISKSRQSHMDFTLSSLRLRLE